MRLKLFWNGNLGHEIESLLKIIKNSFDLMNNFGKSFDHLKKTSFDHSNFDPVSNDD